MGFSLGSAANFICGKVGQFDPKALALCKGYLNARYHMVWDDYFWRDSQTVVVVPLPAGTISFPYPDILDRVVTIRLVPVQEVTNGRTTAPDDGFLDPIDETFIIEADPYVLDHPGAPRYYTEYISTGNDTEGPELPLPPSGRRIKLFPTTPQDRTLYVFGKKPCPDITDDSDVFLLRNCENSIIAYAMGDMLERLRQYGKAKSKFMEAKALLDEAKAVEGQQANKPRRNKALSVRGNSLLELTDAVCAVCGQWTPDVRILIKEFLRRNYMALYDMQLWPESTVCVRVPVTDQQVVLPHYVERVIAVRGMDGFQIMPAEVNYLFGISPGVFETVGTPINFSVLTPVGVGALPPNPPERLVITSSNILDVGKTVFIRGESSGNELTETVGLLPTATNTAQVYTKNAYDIPLTVSKPLTVGDITVNSSTTTALLELIPADERERKHIRLWLLPPPNIDTASISPGPSDPCASMFMVLGKRKITPFRTDDDTPILTGCQAVLIAGAAGDLYARLGDLQSATAYRAKADIAAQILVKENTEQSAYSPRIVPIIEPHPYGVELDTVWSKS